MSMSCRRCTEKFKIVNREDKDGRLSPPESYLTVIGVDHPTCICLDCYDEWYITFGNFLANLSALANKFDLYKTNVIEDAEEMLEINDKIASAEVTLNIETIGWIRKGVIKECISK